MSQRCRCGDKPIVHTTKKATIFYCPSCGTESMGPPLPEEVPVPKVAAGKQRR